VTLAVWLPRIACPLRRSSHQIRRQVDFIQVDFFQMGQRFGGLWKSKIVGAGVLPPLKVTVN